MCAEGQERKGELEGDNPELSQTSATSQRETPPSPPPESSQAPSPENASAAARLWCAGQQRRSLPCESQSETEPEAWPAAIREPQRVEARERAGSAGKERPEGEEEEEEEAETSFEELEGLPPPLPPPLFLHDQKWTPPRPAWAAATWLLPTRASACGEEDEGSAPEWPRRTATTAPVEASLERKRGRG